MTRRSRRASSPAQGRPRTAVGRVVRKVGRVGANVALAPLLPVIAVAREVYRRRTGKKPPLEPLEFVKAWARDIMKKRLYDLDPVTIGMIVTAILSFIAAERKRAMERRAQGQAQPGDEQLIAQGAAAEELQQAGDVDLASVGELLPVMREMYRERTGRSLPDDPVRAIKAFYQDVVLPSQRGGGFDFDYGQPVFGYESEVFDLNVDLRTAIQGVLGFFQAVRDRVREKRRRGESVGRVEAAVEKAMTKVEGEVREQVQTQIAQDVQMATGRAVLGGLPLLLLAGGGILAFSLLKKR